LTSGRRWHDNIVIARLEIPESGPPVTIDQVAVGRRTVLGVAGEIDMATVPELRAAIDAALEAAPRELWIDFTATEFMDSTGLHALLDVSRSLLVRNCRLAIICPDGTVRRLLEVTGVDGALEIYLDRDSAHRAA
jgi:anti-sigma B factor antagonist